MKDCDTCGHAGAPSRSNPCRDCFPPDWPHWTPDGAEGANTVTIKCAVTHHETNIMYAAVTERCTVMDVQSGAEIQNLPCDKMNIKPGDAITLTVHKGAFKLHTKPSWDDDPVMGPLIREAYSDPANSTTCLTPSHAATPVGAGKAEGGE